MDEINKEGNEKERTSWDKYGLDPETTELLRGFSVGYEAHLYPEIVKALEKFLEPGTPFTKGFFIGKDRYQYNIDREKSLFYDLEETRNSNMGREDRDDIELR